MDLLRKICNILAWPVYICIIIYLLIAAPLLTGFRPVVVLSGSMEPTYHVGSIIYYKDTPFERIQAGDSITFHAGEGGSLVTHRVEEKQELSRSFITKGDANSSADPNPVSYDKVAGKATAFCIPFAGYFVSFGKQPAVIGIMAAILIAGIITEQLSKKDEDEKK